MSKKYIPIFMLILTLCIQSFAQEQDESPNQSFTKGAYEACIKICDKMLEADVNNNTANFFKGASMVRLKKYELAKGFLKKAAKNNYQPAVVINTNLLRVYGGLQQTELLLQKLTAMTDNGFGGIFVLNNEEFEYLKTNDTFNKLKSKVDSNANPCKYGAEYQRLDFWLGEWDVYVNDTKIGTSSITKSEGGCTLYEDYKTFSGFLGRSTNYYDPKDSLYTQIWIDKFNSITIFKEVQAKEDYLLMSVDKGAGNLTRMSYLKDPKSANVTQTMEASKDNGKTWTTNFVGVYKER